MLADSLEPRGLARPRRDPDSLLILWWVEEQTLGLLDGAFHGTGPIGPAPPCRRQQRLKEAVPAVGLERSAGKQDVAKLVVGQAKQFQRHGGEGFGLARWKAFAQDAASSIPRIL